MKEARLSQHSICWNARLTPPGPHAMGPRPMCLARTRLNWAPGTRQQGLWSGDQGRWGISGEGGGQRNNTTSAQLKTLADNPFSPPQPPLGPPSLMFSADVMYHLHALTLRRSMATATSMIPQSLSITESLSPMAEGLLAIMQVIVEA